VTLTDLIVSMTLIVMPEFVDFPQVRHRAARSRRMPNDGLDVKYRVADEADFFGLAEQISACSPCDVEIARRHGSRRHGFRSRMTGQRESRHDRSIRVHDFRAAKKTASG
jgi:hypothetical protein